MTGPVSPIIGPTGKWATCKKCKKEMQGIPERLKQHFKIILKPEQH